MRATRLLVLGAALVLAGCPNAGEDQLLRVGGTGVVQGGVAFDWNGSRAIEQAQDSPMAGVRVRLVTTSGLDSVAVAVSTPGGFFQMSGVPVGTYRVVIDSAPLGDTAVVARLDSTTVTVLPGDTVSFSVIVSYPHYTILQARAATVPLGRRVFIEGIALNLLSTFRDTTLHVQDNSAAIRATRVRATPFNPGDSVRLRGTMSVRTGQRTIDDVTMLVLAPAFVPSAAGLSTLLAAGAAGGTRDAQIVQVLNALITDTLRVPGGGGWQITVNDTTGPLQVLLDATADPAFTTAQLPPLPASPYIPNNRFDIVGVLVPTGAAGTWRLKPRNASDLVQQ